MVSEQFRKKKVDAAAIWRKTQLSKRTNGARSRATEAEKIVQEGPERFGLSESDLKSSPGSDPRKVAIAGFIHQSTTTPQSWTAERLQMKSQPMPVNNLVVRKRLRNRKSSQQNQLSSHDLLTDPFAARLTENLGLGFGTLRSNEGIALLLERAQPKPITR
jgi:hypothetical protein